jgi:hypothetical protein
MSKKTILDFTLPFVEFQKEVLSKFGGYAWTKPEYKNECLGNGSVSKSKLELNPTQRFVTEYVHPNNPNGVLMYHSVGSGKTLSALSIARKFEKKNFSVIWVTRSSLRKDIDKGLKLIPLENKFMVISYKQFSNILKRKGLAYEELVKTKGGDDPLNKTLVIIDEAHKLYTKDLKPQEMHDIKTIQNMIYNSYDKSGFNAVKLVLMTATPVTEDPLELIRLLNLIIESPQDRFEVNTFKKDYLDEAGKFTKTSLIQFKSKVKGLVSYLDLSKDPRRFAQVEYIEKLVPISELSPNVDFQAEQDRCTRIKKQCLQDNIPREICNDNNKRCLDRVNYSKHVHKTTVTQVKQMKERCKIEL